MRSSASRQKAPPGDFEHGYRMPGANCEYASSIEKIERSFYNFFQTANKSKQQKGDINA
jgi:hypothetical protein